MVRYQFRSSVKATTFHKATSIKAMLRKYGEMPLSTQLYVRFIDYSQSILDDPYLANYKSLDEFLQHFYNRFPKGSITFY